MARHWRWSVVMVGMLLGGVAAADSWMPPKPETYTSASGDARVTITPRDLESSLAYFQDAVDGKAKPGQREGSARTQPMAKMEVREGRRWRTLYEQPLVNGVGPVEAIVADGGRYLATFDNWHSAGYGDDVVAIYDAKGALVRKFALDELVSSDYIALLPRTVSSLWWRGTSTFSEQQDVLVVGVIEPSEDQDIDGDPNTVPVRIRLSDGELLPHAGPEWERTRKVVAGLQAKRLARWQEKRALRAQPLSPPTGNDADAWRAYMVELRERLSAETGKSHGGTVIAARGQAKKWPMGGTEDIALMLDGFQEKYRLGDDFLFVSPDSQIVVDALVQYMSKAKPGSLAGASINLLGTVEEGEWVRAAAAASGAKVVLIDKTQPYPGGSLPDAPPDWFE